MTESVSAHDRLRSLTAREWQVFVLLARGSTNREIAESLQISVKTVDTHRGHLCKKLAVRNNSRLTLFAIKHSVINVDGKVLLDAPPNDLATFDPAAGGTTVEETPTA